MEVSRNVVQISFRLVDITLVHVPNFEDESEDRRDNHLANMVNEEGHE